MEKVKSDMVEAKVVVREYCWVELDTRQKAFGSQAVSTPPLLPDASRHQNSEREVGRKVFALRKLVVASFVS